MQPQGSYNGHQPMTLILYIHSYTSFMVRNACQENSCKDFNSCRHMRVGRFSVASQFGALVKMTNKRILYVATLRDDDN
jgi:hypothetical protein